jgi:protein phosphatase|tara:strand:+ start:2782 stop:3444 length:663 start_codon:yes stop_codon:yes gene_type:complete
MENKIKIIWTSSSICGPVREVNEDTIYPEVSGTTKESFVAGVCDGLGGHKHGEVASSIAINQLEKKFDSVLEVIYSANREILSHQKLNPETLGMATTMTLVYINREGLLKLGHIGDSRCYILSDRELKQLSIDHTVDGSENILTQAVGLTDKINPQLVDYQLSIGDVVLICSDGFYNEVSEVYLKRKLQEGATAEALVNDILANEPRDNVSAVIMNITKL